MCAKIKLLKKWERRLGTQYIFFTSLKLLWTWKVFSLEDIKIKSGEAWCYIGPFIFQKVSFTRMTFFHSGDWIAISYSQTGSIVTSPKAAKMPTKKRSLPICIGTNQVDCFTLTQTV